MSSTESFNSAVIELIEEMADLYQEKRESKRLGERTFRGRATPLAGQFEDKVALLIEGFLPCSYKVLVDYPISYKLEGEKYKITVYPDILIVRDPDELRGVIELKIDLGYLHDEWRDSTQQMLRELKEATQVSYRTSVNTPGSDSKLLQVSQSLAYALVVLTGQNDHGRLARFLADDDYHCFVLSHNVHPNEPNQTDTKANIEAIRTCPDNLKHWGNLGEFLETNFRE